MNSYFQFKQFTINQDKCAMKVCTDACLFGAWVANKLQTNKPSNILDIGSGTGLLSLMLAQKIDTKIHSVEIDEDAFVQAKKNIEDSVFKNSINILFADITTQEFATKFDAIICNPPFFENQLKSNNAERNTAMHATTLSYKALSTTLHKNLTKNGSAFLLLPHYAVSIFEKELALKNLYTNHIVQIKHSPTHDFFRDVLVISKTFTSKKITEISIKNDEGNYSNDFIYLMKDYYLYL